MFLGKSRGEKQLTAITMQSLLLIFLLWQICISNVLNKHGVLTLNILNMKFTRGFTHIINSAPLQKRKYWKLVQSQFLDSGLIPTSVSLHRINPPKQRKKGSSQMRAAFSSYRYFKIIDFGVKGGKSAVTIYYAQPVAFIAAGCFRDMSCG